MFKNYVCQVKSTASIEDNKAADTLNYSEFEMQLKSGCNKMPLAAWASAAIKLPDFIVNVKFQKLFFCTLKLYCMCTYFFPYFSHLER